MPLQGRSFLSLNSLTGDEIGQLLKLSTQVKRERQAKVLRQRLAGYTLAMIFEKQSTRTRSAFETAFGEEGGHPVFLGKQDVHLGTKESIEDSARVLGGMFDLVAFRGYRHATVEKLAQYAGIPVINALTDDHHPTQILADLLTIQECFGQLAGLKLCFVGDSNNNVARSLMIGCAKMGMNVCLAAPPAFQPPPALIQELQTNFCQSGNYLQAGQSMTEALRDAHVVYTDVWVSMGQESDSQNKESALLPYQVNQSAMQATGRADSIFLHCLPANKGKEVTFDIFEGPQSRVWQEAENRKHTIKAVCLSVLGLTEQSNNL